jgi:hypothetical protein
VMFVFAPLILLQGLDLFRLLGGLRSPRLMALLVLGGYFLGAGFGMHEPFNRLHLLWRGRVSPELLGPLVYFDDDLGHWSFFAGFGCIVVGIVGAELSARIIRTRTATATAVASGLLLAAIVFVNMWREPTSLDLTVMTAICAATAALHARLAPREFPPPLALTVYLGLGGGTLATLAAWALHASGG